jgi:hypothetical protein
MLILAVNVVVELTEPFQNDLAIACIEALKSVSDKATIITVSSAKRHWAYTYRSQTGGAKLFASFSSFDTTKVLYDDAEPLKMPLREEREWAISKVVCAH